MHRAGSRNAEVEVSGCSIRGTGLHLFSRTAGSLVSAYLICLVQTRDRGSVTAVGRWLEVGDGNAAVCCAGSTDKPPILNLSRRLLLISAAVLINANTVLAGDRVGDAQMQARDLLSGTVGGTGAIDKTLAMSASHHQKSYADPQKQARQIILGRPSFDGTESREFAAQSKTTVPVPVSGRRNSRFRRGTNSEQLFAAAYTCSFVGVLRLVAAREGIALPPDAAIPHSSETLARSCRGCRAPRPTR
jgi:organic hydroperoxide reductase OsmC/OhrA